MYAPRYLRPNSDFIMTFQSVNAAGKQISITSKLVEKSQIEGKNDRVTHTTRMSLSKETPQRLNLAVSSTQWFLTIVQST